MNVTELRLGNYVYQIDRSNEIHLPVELPLEISKIGILSSEVDGLKINNIRPRDIRNFDLSPIPLSMKWLHKLGFSEFASSDRMRFEANGKSIMVSFAECRNVWQWQGIDLLSVHQLQNLFFALTGEELTIKELSK